MRPRSSHAIPLCVFLFATLLYVNTYDHGFVLDDQKVVAENPLIRGLENVPFLFASDYWGLHQRSGLYRPLATTSYALNFELGGLHPGVYHCFNTALHALVSVLAWLVYRRVGGDVLVAAAGAFLFASHPVHTEAVTGIAGRADLLASLFFLASLLGHAHGREAKGRRFVGLYVASLAAYLLALLSKESAITLLGVLLVFDFVFVYGRAPTESLLPRLKRTITEGWRLYSGYLLMTVLYVCFRLLALGFEQALPPVPQVDNPLVVLDLPWRIVSALDVAVRYLGLLFFPLHLSYDYSHAQIAPITSLADLRFWFVLAVSGGVVAAVAWSYRVSKPLFFSIAFYLVTFSAVSNLLVLIGTIMGERLIYLPSVGFCLALALVLWKLCSALPVEPRAARAFFLAMLVLIVGLGSVRTIDRNGDWRSQEELYLHDFQVVPGSAKALVNAAYALAALGRDGEAISLLEGAVRRGIEVPAVYNNLGFILIEKEMDVSRGVSLVGRALELEPNNPDFLDSLAWGYFKLGRFEEAGKLLRRSLELDDWSGSTEYRRSHLETIERALRRREIEAERSAEGDLP
jgi:hypothetical protein